jgi:hypothetical protein
MRMNVAWPVLGFPGFTAVLRPNLLPDPLVWLEVYRPNDPDPVAMVDCRPADALETACRWAARFLSLIVLGAANGARWAMREREQATEGSYRWEVLWINRFGSWGHWTYADTREEAERLVRETIYELNMR